MREASGPATILTIVGCRGRERCRGCEWEGEPEGRPAPRSALNPHLPVMTLNDVLGDRQANAYADLPATLPAPNPTQPLPSQPIGPLCPADPLIVYTDTGHRPHACSLGSLRFLDLQTHQDGLLLWGVLERVREVVGDRLLDPCGINVHWDR